MGETTTSVSNQFSENELIEKNLPLVYYFANKYSTDDPDNLVGVGQLALLEAARKFDSNRGIPFSSFSSLFIQRAMSKEVKKNSHHHNVGTLMSDVVYDEKDNIKEIIPNTLTKKQLKVLDLRLQGCTFEEIGEEMGGYSKSWAEKKVKEIIEIIRECNNFKLPNIKE